MVKGFIDSKRGQGGGFEDLSEAEMTSLRLFDKIKLAQFKECVAFSNYSRRTINELNVMLEYFLVIPLAHQQARAEFQAYLNELLCYYREVIIAEIKRLQGAGN